MSSQPSLSILQYNVMRSKDKVMASLLRDERMGNFDIIAIQEPWRNSYFNTTHYPCGQSFDLLYPDDPDVRACFLVNKRIPKARWTATYHSLDLNTFIFSPSERDGDTLHVHNLYNPTTDTGQSTIPILREVLTRTACDSHIVVGDFNLHYPLWGGE